MIFEIKVVFQSWTELGNIYETFKKPVFWKHSAFLHCYTILTFNPQQNFAVLGLDVG